MTVDLIVQIIQMNRLVQEQIVIEVNLGVLMVHVSQKHGHGMFSFVIIFIFYLLTFIVTQTMIVATDLTKGIAVIRFFFLLCLADMFFRQVLI